MCQLYAIQKIIQLILSFNGESVENSGYPREKCYNSSETSRSLGLFVWRVPLEGDRRI